MSSKIMKLVEDTRKSAFNRNNYSVTRFVYDFKNGMLLHTWYDKKDSKVSNKEWLEKVTPAFQRANNKWTKKQKLLFIENLLKGVQTELLFFRFNEDEDALLLDGLQRTTAIIDFFEGKIKPFGYSYEKLKGHMRLFGTNLEIKIYTFKDMEEVVKFYIEMNEGITHSKADIQKAKDWLLDEYGVKV